MEIKKGKYGLSIDFELADEAEVKLLQPSVDYKLPKSIYRLNEFCLRKFEVTEELTLVNLLPVGWKVFVLPHIGRHGYSSSFADLDNKLILIQGDVSSPSKIVILLHECGHANDLNLAEEISNSTHDISYDQIKDPANKKETVERILAENLKDEHNAWDFALKRLQPFLDGDEIKDFGLKSSDVIRMAKGESLYSYSINAKNVIENMQTENSVLRDYSDEGVVMDDDYGTEWAWSRTY